MKKQSMAALAILLITCLIGLGVTQLFDMSAYERISKLLSASTSLESYHAEVEGHVDMSIRSEEEIPEFLESVFKMYSNMQVELVSDVIMKPENYQMALTETLDMNGMSFEIEAYLENDTMIIKYPIFGKYIHIAASDLETLFDFKLPDHFMQDVYSLMPEFQQEAAASLMTYFTDENVKYVDDYTMVADGYAQTLKVIEIDMDMNTLINVYVDVLMKMLDNEKAHDLVLSVIELNPDKITVDIDEEIESIKAEIEAFKSPEKLSEPEFVEVYEMLKDTHLTYQIGVSNLNIPKRLWVNFNMSVPVEEMEDAYMDINYALTYTLSQFNQIDSINIPSIEDEDVLPLSELIEKFGGL